MIQFFKTLFAAIFGKKKVSDVPVKPVMEPAIYPDQAKIDEMNKELASKESHELARKLADELTKVKQIKESRRWRMRNNRILIQYSHNCNNVRMNGKMESMRCTRLERAREIASRIQSYCVKKIVFADRDGQQFIIKSFN